MPAKDVETPLLDVSRNGSRVESLKVLRDRLAVAIDNPLTAPRDLASLSKQYADVLAQIEAEEPHKKEDSALDELNARRAARGAAPARAAGTGMRR